MGIKKRSKLRKLAVFIILAGLLGGGAWYSYKKFRPVTPAADPSQAYSEVANGSLESVVTSQGTLEPKDYVDVGAQVSGRILKLHADIGDTVKKGDLLAEIDPAVYQSEMEGDQAKLKTLQAQKLQQEAQVAQAQQDLNRNETLFNQAAISKEVYEQAQTALKVAKAQLASYEAQIEEAQSSLDGAKTNLGYTKIFTPMDGTVVTEPIKEGQTINASQTAPVIAQIADLDVMTARAQVAEADVSKLKAAMPVYFTTLGSQGRRWKGEVRQILPTPETVNNVVLYDVLVDVENKDRQLMTGMTTQMFFEIGSVEDKPLIPVSALIRRMPKQDTEDGKAYKVQVMGASGPEDKVVIIGLSDREEAEIISGLSLGDKVITQAPKAGGSGTGSGQRAGGGARMGGGGPRL